MFLHYTILSEYLFKITFELSTYDCNLNTSRLNYDNVAFMMDFSLFESWNAPWSRKRYEYHIYDNNVNVEVVE